MEYRHSRSNRHGNEQDFNKDIGNDFKHVGFDRIVSRIKKQHQSAQQAFAALIF
jgi:hypothetical protein